LPSLKIRLCRGGRDNLRKTFRDGRIHDSEEPAPELFDHQHYLGELDDGGDFQAHLDIQLSTLCRVMTFSIKLSPTRTPTFCCDYSDVHSFNRASQLIARRDFHSPIMKT
jgi:hypothetical protein